MGRKMLVPRDLREMGCFGKENPKKHEKPLQILVQCAESPVLAATAALHSPPPPHGLLCAIVLAAAGK